MLTAKTADGRYGLLRRAALLKAMKKGAAKAPLLFVCSIYISMLDAVRGKGKTSRMLAMPVTYITMRSNPRP